MCSEANSEHNALKVRRKNEVRKGADCSPFIYYFPETVWKERNTAAVKPQAALTTLSIYLLIVDHF